MRKPRTIYFNDARHYYLFVFEPPMKLEDAYLPIDEVAGTGVDTFSYGVERGDGLFYPSRMGGLFGADMQPFQQAAYWRTWHNMQSLIERGLNPLQILIDRAHEKGMAFIASLRMGGFGGMDPALRVTNGGPGLAHPDVQAHQFEVLKELIEDYPIDGIELDFAVPGGSRLIRPEDADTFRPALTEYVERIVDRARKKPCEVGVRVLPTEALNLSEGIDVCDWLNRGLLDFTVPLRYGYMLLDPDLPVDWLIDAAHQADTSVYGLLQPYVRDQSTGAPQPEAANLEQIRAAAANYRAKGMDGVYAWFLPWPFGDPERRILTELGDPDLTTQQDKHYVLARNVQAEEDMHYPVHLPVEIAASDTGQPVRIPFFIADDVEVRSDRLREVQLKIHITDLVSADRLTIRLNGQSLENEICMRDFSNRNAPYTGQWLAFHLAGIRPRQGDNVLEIILEGRPADLVSPLRVEDVEIILRYGPYPSAL